MNRAASIRRSCVPLLGLLAGAAAPAPSFDCTKAAGATERLICSDDGLAALDRALADQFDALRRRLSPEGSTVLRTAQLRWLASRAPCVAKENSREQAVTCLGGRYSERADELKAQYATAGTLSIENRASTRTQPRLHVSEFDSYPLMIGPKAQAEPFNRYISRRLDLEKGMFAASGIKLDPRPPGETSFSRYYEIHRFDDRLISIEIFQAHESYFGHGWQSQFAINWDVRRGQPLRVADIFRDDQDWQRALYQVAMKLVREEGEIAEPESWFSSDALDDDDAWLFDAEGGVLLLGHGERSMVGASADVPIPYDVLRPFLRPDSAVAPPRE